LSRDLPTAMAPPERGEQLVDTEIPPLTLPSTEGPVDLHALAGGPLSLFIYPHATGLPEAPVAGWEMIPGARGCTAQACGFRDSFDRLRVLGAEVAGLSVQSVEEQRAFASRVGIQYRLISDPDLRLAETLGLPTFSVEGRTFYRRLTLIASKGRIVEVFSPITDPGRNAIEVAEWLEGAENRSRYST